MIEKPEWCIDQTGVEMKWDGNIFKDGYEGANRIGIGKGRRVVIKVRYKGGVKE